jgi:hypothetical protein
MKKTLIALTIIILSIAARQISSVNPSSPSKPNPIQDPQLRQAWDQLNALTEPVQLPDGSTLTGHGLAQFVLNQNITIQWDENNTCKGSSCSVRSHIHGETAWTIDGPIYLRLGLKDETMSLVVEAMAHEIYHYTQPFGQVNDSLYEEYMAFNSSARIAHTTGMDDACANPMQPDCLKHWFEVHRLMYGYTQFQVYPPSLMASVDTTSQTCSANAETTAEQPTPEAAIATPAEPTANQEFTINQFGLPDYKTVATTTGQ